MAKIAPQTRAPHLFISLQTFSNHYVQDVHFMHTCGQSVPSGRKVRCNYNSYTWCLNPVRSIRKRQVQTVRSPQPDGPRPSNKNHPSSIQTTSTQSNCPPYKDGRSATWELVLFELKPWTVRSTIIEKHTVPAQFHFGTRGQSSDPSRTLHTGTQ
jgi:hypothetical protein